ncbi:MAG: glycosyl hydrolase family 43 [Cyclobacteriaceae bacterium]|nr:MAG: glycosyl hydrolase family 43 [Cyclobacteriaceae bacterium]
MKTDLIAILLFLLISPTICGQSSGLKLEDIRVRDPFILPVPETNTYYLYAQKRNKIGSRPEEVGVEVYKSKDLKLWDGPYSVFQAPDTFWGRQMVWAPEVHEYQGNYYLFVTFTGNTQLKTPGQTIAKQWKRGTQILKSEHPDGPFNLISKFSQTPVDWMALDGSLWVEDGQPYMVFCHEWAQIMNGSIELLKLSADLSKAIGEPQTLFKATDWPGTVVLQSRDKQDLGYVTDGNFIYKTKQGKLVMIWSTYGTTGYVLVQAVSDNGRIAGPWRQIEEPLVSSDGGHGMIFKTFEGNLMLTFHQPNRDELERTQLFPIEDLGDRIRIIQ